MRGGGPLADAERPIFVLVDWGLTGDTWPLSSSDLGWTSISSTDGSDGGREAIEGERLVFRCTELTDDDLEALVESSCLSLVKVAEPISCAGVASTEPSRLTSMVSLSSTDCFLEAEGFTRPMVRVPEGVGFCAC